MREFSPPVMQNSGKKKILIVENEAIVAKNMELRLATMGYAVTGIASSGKKALELTQRIAPDLILMDIRLKGGMNGLEIAAKIREQYHIPVVYVTAHADEITLQKAKVTEPFGYVVKPFEETTLYSAIEMALYKHKMERKLRESEARYHAIVNDQMDLICRYHPDGVLTFVNRAFCRFFGKPVSVLEGTLLQNLLPVRENMTFQKLLSELNHRNPLTSVDLCLTDAAGDTHWHQWMNHAIFDERKEMVEIQSVARDLTDRRTAEEALENSRETLRNLTAHLESVREDERTAVAREIHDELGQALTAIKMDLSLLKKKMPDNDVSLNMKVEDMTGLIDATMQTVKRITSALRPGLLDDLGLAAAIEWQAGEFEKRTGIECRLSIKPADLHLDEKLSTSVFRIFQETLTNIARHAAAKRVDILFRRMDGQIKLVVRDNGCGISPDQILDPQSFGIIGMRERAHYLGGELVITGEPGNGTTVTLSIPVERDETAFPKLRRKDGTI